MKPSELTDEQLVRLLVGVTDFNLEYEATGPGKFEGNNNPGLAEAIYNRSLQGWNDDETGSVEWECHYSLLGRFVLSEDSFGFVTLIEFPSEHAARIEFDIADQAYAEWCDGDD